ncbi:SDR family oxidoreductase [Rhizobium leguminosarum]|uniref:SDR family oxidoreductase n=1 Tax=Rhizobium leguminosarum TaxID=384 RepID=UPI001F1B6DA1|nr:SDR family oxidoreductase [Rhizobium leguminosarum]UIJ83275.1 SDR family oxidoreductase [Rhizobium leguminosarum]
MKMLIGVTGANGNLGRLVIAELRKRVSPDQIVALARSPEKVAHSDVDVRAFDYEKKDALAPALDGIDTLIMISSTGAGTRVAQHRNVIQAAQAAGIKRIIYTGVLHTDTSSWALVKDHKITEADLKETGIPVTVMRHSIYSDVYVPRIAEAVMKGAFIGSVADGRTASASRADLAEALAIVATSAQEQSFKVYELAGDDAWTMEELAEETSLQLGAPIPYRNLSTGEHVAELVAQGVPEERAPMIVGLDTAMRQGSMFDDSHALSTLLGRPTASLKDLVAQGIKAAAQ